MGQPPVAQNLETRPGTERWWEAVFSATRDPQIVCQADGTAVQINRAAARRFNLDPRAHAGTFCILDLLPDVARPKVLALLQRSSPLPSHLHSVMTVVNGQPRLFADLELLPLGDGHTLVTFRDAGQRQRLEAHVRHLVTALDATPDVFFVTDPEFRIAFANPAFQVTTGYPVEEVLGRPDAFLRAPGQQEKVRQYVETVTRGREWLGELINRRADGTLYPVEATISPICDLAGRFVGYVACERDLTVRKRLEDDLRRERDFARSILESLDGAIYTLDRQLRLTHTNDGWRRLPADHGGIHLDGPPQLGRPLLDYVTDPARREELRTAFEQVLRSAATQESRFHAADGRHWLVRISPWVQEGSVCGLICSITDQSRLEELQDQLFQAQKMELIGTLAAGVAHDFNNLLQAIRGHTGLLLMQADQPSALRQSLEQIDTAAGRAAEITHQLLSFSRRSREQQRVLDLNQVLQEATEFARHTLRRNIDFRLQPAPQPVPVRMDASRAHQALINLCVNAQDAMPGGGRLTLSTAIVELPPALAQRHGLKPGHKLARCSVSDTGVGIPADVLPRLFQPFFTTKAPGKGTGLGLSIVQRIVEEAGGFIEVESTVGQGTTFHLHFPLAASQPSPPPGAPSRQLPPVAGRVLVVDDMDLVRDFTVKFLEAAGLSVEAAASGPEALKLLETMPEAVDLVFTDYRMPGMNGVELIEAVAARWPRVKFLLASGYLDDTTRARVQRCNGSVLDKPYEMRVAVDTIVRLLGRN